MQKKNLFKVNENDLTCIKIDNVLSRDKALAENFSCSVCLDLIYSPITCSTCKGLVGKSCLDACLLKRKSCPLCGIDTFKQALTNDLKSMQELKKISLRCENKNCGEIIAYDNYYNHIKKCKNIANSRRCEYCSQDFALNMINYHINNCEYKTEKCDVCNKVYQIKDASYHLMVDCEESKVVCEYCGDSFSSSQYKLHKSNKYECDKIIERKFNNLKISASESNKDLINVRNFNSYTNANNGNGSNFNNNNNFVQNQNIHKRSASSNNIPQIKLQNYQNNIPNKILSGNKLRSEKLYNEAISCYLDEYKINPKNQTALLNIAYCYQELKKYNESIEYFNKIIFLDQNSKQAYFGIGLSLQNMGKYNEAINCYNRVISFDSKFKEAYNNIGFCLMKQNKYSEACETYYKIINLEPKDYLAHYNLGCTLQRLNKLTESITSFKESINLNPKYMFAYYNLGCSYFQLTQYNASIDMYIKTIALNPNYLEAFYALGCSYEKLMNFTKALEYYMKVYELNSNYFGVAKKIEELVSK